MRVINVIIVVAGLLGITHAYDVNCFEYYSVQENENGIKIAATNELSLPLLTSLNPGINYTENLEVDSKICIQGEILYSKDGTCGEGKGSCPHDECCGKDGYCGTSENYCGIGCNPNYGMCSEVKPQIDYSSPSFESVDGSDAMNTNNNSKITIDVASVEDYDNKKIDEMAQVLSMDSHEAKHFYESAEKGISYFEEAFITSVDYHFTVEQCQDLCYDASQKFNSLIQDNSNPFNLTAYNEYKESVGDDVMDNEDLINLCKSQCFVIKEVNEYISNEENNMTMSDFMNKRETSNDNCRSPSSVTISLVTNNYLNGSPKYRIERGSTDNILAHIDGCSIPIIAEQYNSNDRGLFLPACNSHDICYGCQAKDKNTCDSLFLDNMKTVCKLAEDNSLVCRLTAQVFYTAVSLFGQTSYDASERRNINPNCGYCGASPIYSELLYTPFYVEA